ncbi:MAG: hypothetical protein K6F07_03240 [Bacilli bacterium]|nr:hypothetical protein [Bacilli bacterium]
MKTNINYKVEKSEIEGMTFLKVIAEKCYFNVTLCDLGASIYEVFFNQKRMTLTPRFPSDFKKTGVYHGKTIGRVANRIKDAKINIDGTQYSLDPNENGNTLHGGRNGISTKYFDYKIIDNNNIFIIEFHYVSPHLEAGFPETADIYVRYGFPKEFDTPHFYIVYDVDVDRKTPIKLTNHAYWNLGGELKDLSLSLNSNRYVKVNEKNLLFEEIVKLSNGKGPAFNHTEVRRIIGTEHFPNGVDNYFYFLKGKDDEEKIQLVLENDHSAMIMFTNFPGVQLYTDNFYDETSFFKTKAHRRRAIAIEPSEDPFNSGNLNFGEHYHRFICYQFFDQTNK